MSALSLAAKEDTAEKRRPYWHVDAKWASSLILCVALAAWLLLAVAYRVTERETAIQLMTNMVTIGLDRGDTQENQQAIEKLRQQIAESPTKSIQPIPGFPAMITEADLNLKPAQLRNKIFRQITEPLYDSGARKLAEQQTSNKAQQDKFVNDASTLSLISKESHDRLGGLVLAGGVVVLVVAIAAILFSHRFGRLVTPAVVLLMVSLPGLVLFSGLRVFTSQPSKPITEAQDYFQLAASAKGAFVPAAVAAQQVYIIAAAVAGGLLLIAGIGKLVHAFIKRSRQKEDSKI